MKMLGIKRLPKESVGTTDGTSAAAAMPDDETIEAASVDDVPPAAPKYEINSISELNDYWADKERRFRKKDGDDIDYDALLAAVDVRGDTQIIGSPEDPDKVHPVLQLLHERRQNKSPLTPTTESRPDGFKVALVVEGGGMRGCLSAGMVAAIHYLGLEDTFDVIYGSSAGTVIGAYFNTRQLPWFGP